MGLEMEIAIGQLKNKVRIDQYLLRSPQAAIEEGYLSGISIRLACGDNQTLLDMAEANIAHADLNYLHHHTAWNDNRVRVVDIRNNARLEAIWGK